MKDYKENFDNGVSYAVHKLDSTALKLISLGALGSLYVGMAYMIFIVILASWPGAIAWDVTGDVINNFKIEITGPALFVAAALFPVGIVLIVFLGGSLFTSDNLTMLAWITKQKHINGTDIRFKKIFVKWMYTLLGNIIGALIIGAITRAANFFSSRDYQLILGYLIGKKIISPWYFVIASGFLCNILVAGSIWASLAASHSTAKFLLIYFPIWMFAISGFQHVVANGILFAMGLFYMINPEEQANVLLGINYMINHDTIAAIKSLKALNEFKLTDQWVTIGGFLFRSTILNMIPSMVGNWISGSIFLPFTYYYLSGYYKRMKTSIHRQTNDR